MKIDNNELQKLNPKSARFIKDLSEEEKVGEFNVPDVVIKNIADYPTSSFHEDKTWKLINILEREDGSGNLFFVRNNEKLGTKEMETSTITWFTIEDTFALEKEQFTKGILKEISELTLDKHIENKTFTSEHLNKIKVTSSLGKKITLGEITKIKNDVLELK